MLIKDGEGEITATTASSENLEVAFNNGQGFTGVVFRTPALNMRGCSQLDISGISTKEFKFIVEYKKQKGEIVAKSDYNLFPSASKSQTISIPIEYNGEVDEIALMFYVKGEGSEVDIESIYIK